MDSLLNQFLEKHGYPTESKISTSKFLALMIPLEYLAPLTFSLTSNAKTVLTKIVSNPINVKGFQEKMAQCVFCKSRKGIKGVPDFPG